MKLWRWVEDQPWDLYAAIALVLLLLYGGARMAITLADTHRPSSDVYHPSTKEEPKMFNLFSISVYIDGIITADHVAYFDVPCDCSLVAVSAAANSASTGGTFDLGSAADTDGYIDGAVIGAQDGAFYDLDDFDGALVTNQGDDYPHITKGTTLVLTVIDGETSPTGTHVVMYFTPG